MNDLTIRPYEPGDRAAVRQICCDTADKGEPVERFFPDRELFADLVTRYYTDFEPSSSWVADRGGKVVGYLNGCLNTRRYQGTLFWCIIPAVLLQGIGRGTLLHRQTWKLLLDGFGTWLRGGFRSSISLEGYPAHLHINVRREFRGHRIGERLIRQFIEQAWRAGLKGVHLVTREDNLPARRFFEQLGFFELARRPAGSREGEAQSLSQAVVYGKSP